MYLEDFLVFRNLIEEILSIRLLAPVGREKTAAVSTLAPDGGSIRLQQLLEFPVER